MSIHPVLNCLRTEIVIGSISTHARVSFLFFYVITNTYFVRTFFFFLKQTLERYRRNIIILHMSQVAADWYQTYESFCLSPCDYHKTRIGKSRVFTYSACEIFLIFMRYLFYSKTNDSHRLLIHYYYYIF